MKTSKRLTKDELRALLPKRLNKLGEWYFSRREPAIDLSEMTGEERKAFMRLAMR